MTNSLVEICNSAYAHSPLESFGKKYYRQRFGNKLICEECKNAYITEVSNSLTESIMGSLMHVILSEDDELSFTFEQKLNNDYMKYILPIKFEITINFKYNDPYMDEAELNNIKIAYATIIPTCSLVPYPSFKIKLAIPAVNSEEYIKGHIAQYLDSFISSFFIQLSDYAVHALMNKASTKTYTSDCSCSATGPKCTTCSSPITTEYYIYNNQLYCLNCMYEIVVNLASKNNVTDDVGLSIDKYYTNYTIVDTPEWKRSVIDKYINKMLSIGLSTGITRITNTSY